MNKNDVNIAKEIWSILSTLSFFVVLFVSFFNSIKSGPWNWLIDWLATENKTQWNGHTQNHGFVCLLFFLGKHSNRPNLTICWHPSKSSSMGLKPRIFFGVSGFQNGLYLKAFTPEVWHKIFMECISMLELIFLNTPLILSRPSPTTTMQNQGTSKW